MSERRETPAPGFDQKAVNELLKSKREAAKRKTKPLTTDELKDNLKRTLQQQIAGLLGQYNAEGDQQKKDAILKTIESLNKQLEDLSEDDKRGSDLP